MLNSKTQFENLTDAKPKLVYQTLDIEHQSSKTIRILQSQL
jgi:hypothetical protein